MRDAIAEQTFSEAGISCSGGEAFSSIKACLHLGSGSGGADPGGSSRVLRRADGEPLTYQVTAGSHGGPPWQNVRFPINLDAAGSASIRPAIYAEILSQGRASRAASTVRASPGRIWSSLSEGSNARKPDQ